MRSTYPSQKYDEQQNITTKKPPPPPADFASNENCCCNDIFQPEAETPRPTTFDITKHAALHDAIAILRQSLDNKVYFLEGALGAGKTTFVRHWLHQSGYNGAVTSPTYALMNEYHTGQRTVIHADLYRLATPDELLYLDVRDWSARADRIFIEWAQNGGAYLPAADVICQFTLRDGKRTLTALTA